MQEKSLDNKWESFLTRHGAVVQNGQVLHFGHPEKERYAAANDTILADLSHLTLIRVEGDDAQSFLNGQLSNDVRLLDGTHSQLAAYCNAKGRMLALFQLFLRDSQYLLQLPASLQANILQRLRTYVLRAKVRLDTADQELQRIGLSGPGCMELLENISLSMPSGDETCVTVGEVTLLRQPGPRPRVEVISPVSTMVDIWERLQTKTIPVGSECWSWLDIQAGVPAIFPETSEIYVPQMVNLDLLGAINFKKGCYPGQEIVARMHYLGRLKQRMYLAHVDTDTPPKPGDIVFAPALPDQSAGSVVNAQAAPAGGYDLLAVIRIDSAQAGELRLSHAPEAQLLFKSFPYLLPSAEQSTELDSS